MFGKRQVALMVTAATIVPAITFGAGMASASGIARVPDLAKFHQ